MVVEVVSRNSGDRDYKLKRTIYAAGRVPAYLIIDPFTAKCVLLAQPKGAGCGADYQEEHTIPFGRPLHIDALDLTLDTEEFQTLS